MKIYPKCVPCLLKRVYYEVNLSDVDKEKRYEAISKALKSLSSDFSGEKATFEVSTELHRCVYDIVDERDPYKEKKDLGNKIANEIVPKIEPLIKDSEDSFRKAILASIISNSFDFGVLEHEVDVDDILENFPERLEEDSIYLDDVDEIKQKIKGSDVIAFVLDNCGEVVFDKILIKEIREMSSADIVLFVRGKPIFNDVTLEEAKEVGIDELVDEVRELGDRAVGVHPEYVPKEVKDRLFSSDLIISKGMANYESFSEFDDDLDIAYLFKTKCGPVADSIGVEVGENIAYLKKSVD